MHFKVHPSCSSVMSRMFSCPLPLFQSVIFSLEGKKPQPKTVVVLFALVLLLKKLSSQVMFWYCFGATDKWCRHPEAGQWAGWWARCRRNVAIMLLGPGWSLKRFGSFSGVQSRSWMSCNHGTILVKRCAGMLQSYLHAQEPAQSLQRLLTESWLQPPKVQAAFFRRNKWHPWDPPAAILMGLFSFFD